MNAKTAKLINKVAAAIAAKHLTDQSRANIVVSRLRKRLKKEWYDLPGPDRAAARRRLRTYL